MPLPARTGPKVRSLGLTLTCPGIAVSVLKSKQNADGMRCIIYGLQSCMLFLSVPQRTWLWLNVALSSFCSAQNLAHTGQVSIGSNMWSIGSDQKQEKLLSKAKLGINPPYSHAPLQRGGVKREVLYSLVPTESKETKSFPLPSLGKSKNQSLYTKGILIFLQFLLQKK